MSRNILIVISDKSAAETLLSASQNLYKPGDRFQLVWVTSHTDLLKEAEADGYTEKSLPGQDAEKNRAVEESEAAAAMQREVAAKYCTSLNALQIPYQVHILPTNSLYIVGELVRLVGTESAALIVLPKSAGAFVKARIEGMCKQPLVLV